MKFNSPKIVKSIRVPSALKMSQSNMWLLFAFVVVAVLFALYARKKYVEKFTNETTVTLYYMIGCPHCEDFMEPEGTSEWDKFKSQAAVAGIKTPEPIESKDPKKPTNIRSFPTITIEKDGKVTTYEGKRSADALMEAAQ